MGPLVVIFLRGGADGLSLVPPVGDRRYHDLRGDLALDTDEVLQVDDTFGLHPGLTNLHRRLLEGTVAVVPAAGLPAVSRSHFDAQFRVEEAGPATGSTIGSGWLGRHLAATAEPDVARPLRAVCFGQAGLPHLLRGTDDALAAPSIAALRLGGERLGETADTLVTRLIEQMWTESPPGHLRTAALAGLSALAQARSIEAPTVGGTGNSGVPGVADTIVAVNAAVGTEVAVLNSGGWDTHRDQGTRDGTFADLVAELDAACESILTGAPDATLLVLSEFGRRVAPNSSGGTDHGRGGVVVVAGPTVSGGIRGDWPGLASLDDGDVPTVNDVRTVVAEIAGSVLGAEPDLIDGGLRQRLGVID